MSYCKWMERLFWFWYAVGLTLMLFYRVPEALAFSNGLFLLFYALYAVSLHPMPTAGVMARYILSLAAVMGLGYLAEYAGVTTGLPFGSYHYTATLGVGLGGVPLAIAAAWAGVIYNGALLASQLPRGLRALAVGGSAAIFDLVLDPVANARGLWQWHGDSGFYSVPWTNFAAWFVLASLLSLLVPQPRASVRERRRAFRLYQAMLLMFGLLAWKEGLGLSAWIAAAVIGWAEWRLRDDNRTQKSVL